MIMALVFSDRFTAAPALHWNTLPAKIVGKLLLLTFNNIITYIILTTFS